MCLTCPLPPPPPFLLSPPLETEHEEEEEEAVESAKKKDTLLLLHNIVREMEVPFASEIKGPPFVCLHSLSHIRCAPIRACMCFAADTTLIPRFFSMDLFIILTHLPLSPIYKKQAKTN